MNRRIILTAFAAVIAATMTTTALAASDAKNPKAMVLQKSDFPAGARLSPTSLGRGKHFLTDEWAVEWDYKIGAKQFTIRNEVVVMSPRVAIGVRPLSSPPLRGYRQITLPKYGDEQVAGFSRKGNEAADLRYADLQSLGLVGRYMDVVDATGRSRAVPEGMLAVWKGRVLWSIAVWRTDRFITKAEAIAQLKRYAPKVMKRVGSG
jgi:hypothetical protein